MHNLTDKLVSDLKPSLYRFIMKRVPDSQAADEILQEAFLKMLSHVDQLEDDTHVRSWAYTIVRHSITDYYRTNRQEVELPETLAEDEIEEDIQAEFAACLRPMLDDLPEKYRQAVLLTEFEGHTLREAADLLGISLPAIKSRVQRGREQLKGLVLQCCHVELDRQGRLIDYQPHCQSQGEESSSCH